MSGKDIGQKRKMALQFALTFLKNEKRLCNLRWHFAKMKIVSSFCADISQK
jgi:hypothetical protein